MDKGAQQAVALAMPWIRDEIEDLLEKEDVRIVRMHEEGRTDDAKAAAVDSMMLKVAARKILRRLERIDRTVAADLKRHMEGEYA